MRAGNGLDWCRERSVTEIFEESAHYQEAGSFSERLAEIVGMDSVRSFAARAGPVRSGSVLRKYLSGDSDPARQALIDIATVAGVTVEWLATGQGPKHGPRRGGRFPGMGGMGIGDEFALISSTTPRCRPATVHGLTGQPC